MTLTLAARLVNTALADQEMPDVELGDLRQGRNRFAVA
jgi:hypothetical protein